MQKFQNDTYVCSLVDVHKKINGTNILRGVNLDIRKGVVTAILGPNGAGKTSTLRVILGLLNPTKGKVEVLGNDVSADPQAIRMKIGLLPQSDAGYKSLTARQNIEFLVKLSGFTIKDVQDQLNDLISRLNLEHAIDNKFGTLSGGERRAVGLIRSILTGSEFLILDEPTTGLDLARAAVMRKIISEQISSGKSVLMSSHVLTDLEELAQDIVIMREGKVIISGSREQIQERFAPGKELEDAIVEAFTMKLEVE